MTPPFGAFALPLPTSAPPFGDKSNSPFSERWKKMSGIQPLWPGVKSDNQGQPTAPAKYNGGLLGLGDDLLFGICDYLDPEDIVHLRQTCKAYAAISRERVVWIRSFREVLKKHNIPEERNFFLPAALSTEQLESLTTRPLRLAKAFSLSNPADAAKYHERDLRLPEGFAARAVSDVVHGRWLAVVGHVKGADPIIQPAKGSLILYDLGLGGKAGSGVPFAKLNVPFFGEAQLVDFAPLPDSTFAYVGYAYKPHGTHNESMYQLHVVDLSSSSFGVVPAFDFIICTETIADVSLCRNMVALDLDCGVIVLIDWVKKTVGRTTSRELTSGAGSRNKAIQLVPGAILLADTWNCRIFSLPLISLAETGSQHIIPVIARQLAPLGIADHRKILLLSQSIFSPTVIPPSVRFLRQPIAHPRTGSATLHVSTGSGQHLVHFSTTLQAFGDPPSIRETLPLDPTGGMAAFTRIGDKSIALLTYNRMMQESAYALGIASLPTRSATWLEHHSTLRPKDAPFHLVPDQPMRDIMHTPDVERPLLRASPTTPPIFGPVQLGRWRLLNGLFVQVPPDITTFLMFAQAMPISKRLAVVVDDIGARLVMLEAQFDSRGAAQTRVRLIEYE